MGKGKERVGHEGVSQTPPPKGADPLRTDQVRDRHCSLRVPTILTGESMTKQAFKDEVDINNIVARYYKTAQLPQGRPGRFGDFESASDYHEAANRVLEAEQAFMDLPAAIRDHVGNDPGELLDLVYNPARREEAQALGLLEETAPQGERLSPGPIDDKKRVGPGSTPDAQPRGKGDNNEATSSEPPVKPAELPKG